MNLSNTLIIIAITWFFAGFIVLLLKNKRLKILVKNPYGKNVNFIENTDKIAYRSEVVVNLIYNEQLIDLDEIADFTINFQDWKNGSYNSKEKQIKTEINKGKNIDNNMINNVINIDPSELCNETILKKK